MAPLVRRTWSPQGQTPVLPHRTRAHQKVSVIATKVQTFLTPASPRVCLGLPLLLRLR
jgi:hypothetical protein